MKRTVTRKDVAEPVATVAKALAALRAFVDGQDEWGVRELSVALDMPPSTVHRLLARLRIEGFVGYDRRHQKYTIGAEFARLSAAVVQRHGVRQAAMPIMRALAERTGESVWLALHDEERHRLAYLAESEPARASGYLAPLGRARSLADNACGIALLAAMGDDARRAALRGAPGGPRRRASDEVLKAIAETRARGYAAMRADEVGAATMIAAAVRDADGRPVCALGVVAPLHRLGAGQERVLGGWVRDAAERLSLRLGAKLLGGASVGSWQDAVGIITGLLRERMPALQIAPATGRGGRNLVDIDEGAGAYALSAASSLYDARRGRGPFERRHPRLRALMHLSQLHLIVVVRDDVTATRTIDLARLRLSPGEQGFSAEQALADAIACARGTGKGSPRGGALIYLDYPEGKRQFEDGAIDALAWMSSFASPLVRELEHDTASRLFALEAGTLDAMIRLNPGYRRGTIPREAFPRWLQADLPTVAVPTVLVCRDDRPDEEVYAIVRTIYEQRATLARLSSVYETLGPDTVLDGLTAPLHPGAARYFEEIGVTARAAPPARAQRTRATASATARRTRATANA